MTEILNDIGEQLIKIFTFVFTYTVLPLGKAAVFVGKKLLALLKIIYIKLGKKYFAVKNYLLSFVYDVKKGMKYVKEKNQISKREGIKEFFINIKKGLKIHKRAEGFVMRTLVLVLCMSLMIAFFVFISVSSIGLRVTVDGVDVGIVEKESDYIEALSDVKRSISNNNKKRIETSYNLCVTSSGRITDRKTLEENIVKAVSDNVKVCCRVSVDGKTLCFVDSLNVFERAKTDAIKQYSTLNKLDLNKNIVSFVNDVEGTVGLYCADDIWQYDKLYNYFIGEKEKQKTYKTLADDNLDKISKKFKVSQKRITELNPDVDFENLDENTTLLISPSKRNLSIKNVSTYVSVEEIPFSTIRQNDSTLDFGTTMTIVSGTTGKDIVSYADTFVDGKMTKKQRELSRFSINNVVNSLVRVGTNTSRLSSDEPHYQTSSPVYTIDQNGTISHSTDNVSPRLTKNQGGNFIWPAPDGCYYLSQDYYGNDHRGIDIIATDNGSCGGRPIVAVADGIVVTATYHPSWGNYIQIDHGDGVITGYAHALDNSIRVRVGDYVHQGQQIGSIGTTGNSSGYHLHFEVWLDGQRVDPKPYLYIYEY